MNTNNTQKVTKPLGRPISNQQKRTNTAGPSKMEVLPPENKVSADMTKPQFAVKKEMKLEKTGSSASKRCNTSIISSTDVSAYDKDASIFEPNRLSQTMRSPQDNASSLESHPAEELKKVASKPFSMKGKAKRVSTTLEDSTEFNHSAKSTNLDFDSSHPHLSTSGMDFNISTDFRSERLLSHDLLLSEQKGNEYTPVIDDLMYDNEDLNQDNREENIEIDINYQDLQKRFEEIASLQRQREEIAREYVDHVVSAKSENGQSLVRFPENFQQIISATVDQAKTMEDLKEKGIVNDNEIERFIREQLITDLKEEQKAEQQDQEEEKEDPYAKEKEKIRELDRILAKKEREYHDRKMAQKVQRLQDLEDIDEGEISTENIDRIFLTDYQKKSRNSISTAKPETKDTKASANKPAVNKPKIPNDKNHIKKNIQGAFSKTNNSLLSKLTEEEQARLQSLMSLIELTPDGKEPDDNLFADVISNPYDSKNSDHLRDIDNRIASYDSVYNQQGGADLIDMAKLPKEKSLREQAEKRALQERNEVLTKKLMEMNDRERMNEVYDSKVIIALAEKLKEENKLNPIESLRKRSDEEDDLERKFREIESNLVTFNTEELLDDLSALSQKAKNVKQNLQTLRENMLKDDKTKEAEAQRAKKRNELLGDYASHKKLLQNIGKESLETGDDNINALERRIKALERDSLSNEERLNREFENARPTFENNQDPDKSVQDYDTEFTEKLKLANPELFNENNLVHMIGEDENLREDMNGEDGEVSAGVKLNGTNFEAVQEETGEEEQIDGKSE